MSPISSLSGSASGLYSFIQSLSGTNQSSATSAGSATNPTQSTSGQAITGTGGHHHHHGGGGAMKQIQDAVTTALQNAQTSGSSSDPNQIIQDAITKVLQNSNSATPGATQSGTDPDGDGDASSGVAGSGTGAKSAQAFQQLLQSVGVSPQQFHQDFLAAVKGAQNGQTNPMTAFQSIPVGSTVDMMG